VNNPESHTVRNIVIAGSVLAVLPILGGVPLLAIPGVMLLGAGLTLAIVGYFKRRTVTEP